MARVHQHPVHVEFGDCDPAQIAYFPNFFRWFDDSTQHFFAGAGVPSWRELERTRGIIGTPVVNVNCRFVAPTTYGDALTVYTSIAEWRERSFRMAHELRRGGELLAECEEIRVFAARDPDNAARIRAVPVPPDLRALCE